MLVFSSLLSFEFEAFQGIFLSFPLYRKKKEDKLHISHNDNDNKPCLYSAYHIQIEVSMCLKVKVQFWYIVKKKNYSLMGFVHRVL